MEEICDETEAIQQAIEIARSVIDEMVAFYGTNTSELDRVVFIYHAQRTIQASQPRGMKRIDSCIIHE